MSPASSQALQPQELADQRLLDGVALESVWGLLSTCPVLTLQTDVRVIEAGHANRTLYFVLSGQLHVRLDVPDDDEQVVSIGPGQAVGEVSVLDAGLALRHVVAAEPTRVLAIDERVVWHLIEVSHDFAVNLLLLLTDRLRANNAHISEATRQKRVFERDAQVDGLTNLFNRRWLNQQLPRLVQRHAFSAQPLSVLLLDIDHFKRFNDDHGHAAGDHVLIAVTRTIQRCVRPTDLSARYGGEELVVVLPHTPLAGALVAAERLRAAIASTPTTMPDGTELPAVTVSIGAASAEPGEAADALLARADACLYEAKGQGRDRVVG